VLLLPTSPGSGRACSRPTHLVSRHRCHRMHPLASHRHSLSRTHAVLPN
jgi:hypothetical protein